MRKQAGWTAVAVAAAVTMMIVGGAGPVFAAEKKAPELGTWQYFEAIETGNFPSQEVSTQVRKSGAEQAPVFETVELGGISYRIGLDTY